jgi:hypothetical protein
MELTSAGAAGELFGWRSGAVVGMAASVLLLAMGCATGPVSDGLEEPVTCSGNGQCPSGFACSADSVCVIAAVVAGSGSGAVACTVLPDTWTNYGMAFFGQSCGGCHTWASSYAGVAARTTQAQGAISAGVMPPGGLDPSARQRAIDWLACGAPL